MQKNRTPIPEEFHSIEDVQDFWNTHSSADYWDDMEDVEMNLSPALKTRLETKKIYNLLRLSERQIKKIEKTAKFEKMGSLQLISKWVVEHTHGSPAPRVE